MFLHSERILPGSSFLYANATKCTIVKYFMVLRSLFNSPIKQRTNATRRVVTGKYTYIRPLNEMLDGIHAWPFIKGTLAFSLYSS